MQPTLSNSFQFRSDINGLRAIAITLVLFYHSGLEIFSSGFLGVDIFFVISGFLMAQISGRYQEKNFQFFLDFYRRRFYRIFPALFFFSITAFTVGLYVLPSHVLKEMSQSIVATFFLLPNLYFFLKTDYFSNLSELAPLLHFWSLGVEFQFYIIFPFLLYITRRFVNGMFHLALFIGIFSLAYFLYTSFYSPTINFYSPFARFWEFCLGVACFYRKDLFDQRSEFFGIVCLALGVSLIFGALYISSSSRLLVLPAAFGTSFLLLGSGKNYSIQKVWDSWYFNFIGKISFSLYLSHNLIFVMARHLGYQTTEIGNLIVLIFLSVGISAASFFLVEERYRDSNSDGGIGRIFRITVLWALIVSCGVFGHSFHGFLGWRIADMSSGSAFPLIDAPTEIEKRKPIWSASKQKRQSPFSQERENKVLILGDSKSLDLYISLATTNNKVDFEVRRLGLDDPCMDEAVSSFWFDTDCASQLAEVLNSSLLKDANSVVLSATWLRSSLDGVGRFVQKLLEMNKRIIILGTGNFSNVGSIAHMAAVRNFDRVELEEYIFKNIRWDHRRESFKLQKLVEGISPEIKFIDKHQYFCDFANQRCDLRNSGSWDIYDGGHLTVEGSKWFGAEISRSLSTFFTSDREKVLDER